MASEAIKAGDADLREADSFYDTKPYWVIWQASIPAAGPNRIRRISQEYGTAARAEADAERFRKSGAVTWIEETRPMAPMNVPAEALDALRGIAPAAKRESVTAIGGDPA
ncbi:MAG TPA: hypothetical protein VIT45_15420 [Allosphingosinicella sp.]